MNSKYFTQHKKGMLLVSGLLVFAVASLCVTSASTPRGCELFLFSIINHLPDLLRWPMLVITQIGDMYFLPLWFLVALWIKNIRTAVWVIASGIGGLATAWIIKEIVARPRPIELAQDAIIRAGDFSGFAFPSGHTTLATTCAVLLAFLVSGKLRWTFVAVAVLVGLSRIYLGAHMPLDVIGGWSLGAVLAFSSYYLYKKFVL